MNLPNFLLVGAEKAGTTALASFLRQHPDICFSEPKETYYFNRKYELGLKWFASHFDHCRDEKAIGEGTVRLLSHPAAPSRISDCLSDVLLICILRNPIDRAFSQYHYYVYSGKATPSQSFSEVIRNEQSDFRNDLINQGKYINHLRKYELYFNDNQMQIVLYQSFRDRPADVVQSIYETLGVDSAFQPETTATHNVTKYPSSRGLYAFVRNVWAPLKTQIESHIPNLADTLRKKVRAWLFDTDKPVMKEADRTYLRELYTPYNDELEQWLGVDLSHWK